MVKVFYRYVGQDIQNQVHSHLNDYLFFLKQLKMTSVWHFGLFTEFCINKKRKMSVQTVPETLTKPRYSNIVHLEFFLMFSVERLSSFLKTTG